VLVAPPISQAEPSPTQKTAEATVEFLSSLLVGDYDTFNVTCRRSPEPGTWTCQIRWTQHTDPYTTTTCRSTVTNGPEEVSVDDSKTTCRARTRGTRSRYVGAGTLK
jgi:hypothetical protein